MSADKNYPFELENAFFIDIDFKRTNEKVRNVEIVFSVELKVVFSNYPEQLQMNLRLKSHKQEPIDMRLELVGLFKYIGNDPDNDRSIIEGFINDRAIYMLWPFLTTLTRIVSAQMGMEPITINIPNAIQMRLQENY